MKPVSAHAWHACVTASVLSWVSIEDKLEHVGTKAFDKLELTQKKSKFPEVPCSPTPNPRAARERTFLWRDSSTYVALRYLRAEMDKRWVVLSKRPTAKYKPREVADGG